MNAPTSIHMPSAATLEHRYLRLLPTINRYARLACRGLTCPHRRNDAVQELHAVVWKWLRRLAQRGIDGTRFPASLAYQAARFVRSHRKIAGSDRSKDALSPLAQAKHGFKVESLPPCARRCHNDIYGTVQGQRQLDVYEQRLQDNTMASPADQAIFRIDLAAWLDGQSGWDRRIINDMVKNEGTLTLAKRHSLSPSRISQKRGEYRRSWRRFCGDEVVVGQCGVGVA